MVNENSDKEYEHPSASELPENKLWYNFQPGDMIWVKHNDSSWWPAQVIDEACVGSKPKKKAKHDCLVRLYGTCQSLYVDPWKSNTEFKMMLKQERKSATEVFSEVFEKELSLINSSGVNSEGAQTKVTTERTSSRKVRKQEGLKQCSYKGVKKAATTENLEDESEDQDQEVGKTATTGATVQKGKQRRDNSAESLRGKRQKQVAHVLDKESCKMGASLVRREGLRRSARSSAKEYLDAADRTASLTDTGASEDADEDSMVAETSAPHTEIKAMVRDILFKEIIDREHDAEMAYVDEVVNGLCSTTMDSMTGDTTASTKGGQGIKQNDVGVEGESSNITQRERKGETAQATKNTMQVTNPGTRNHATTNINPENNNANPMKEVTDTTPNRDAAMNELGQFSARQIRQIRIMQSLGLIAPSGSPFGKSVVAAATRR